LLLSCGNGYGRPAMLLLHRSRAAGLLFLAGLLAASAGCGPNQKARAVVKGNVKFFDKHLTAGSVTFIGKDGVLSGTGNIDYDGNYTVADAPLGPCTVVVKVPELTNMPAGMKPPKPPPGVPDMKPPGGEGGGSDASLIDPSKIVKIPGKYAKPDTSGLSFTVERGQNSYDITLSP
jgi:hypothetical protein